jgi:PKHD-type hydroxylase
MSSKSFYLKPSMYQLFAGAKNVLTKEECEKVIELGLSLTREIPAVQNKDQEIKEDVRRGGIAFFEANKETEWLFKLCADLVMGCNEQFYKYDLDHIELLQFTAYDTEGSKYDKHIDTLYQHYAMRKLSFTIQLSDPETYEGGDLRLHASSNPVSVNRDQGSFVAFPSFTLHEVTPVTKGKRYSLVGWVVGPNFK